MPDGRDFDAGAAVCSLAGVLTTAFGAAFGAGLAGVFAGTFRAGGAFAAAPADFFVGRAGFFAALAGRAAAARDGLPADFDFDATVFFGLIVDMGVGEESLFVLTQLYNMPEEGKDVNDQMPIFAACQAAPRPLFRCRLPSPRLFCAP